MITLEEKIDIILQYIATDDPEKIKSLREEAASALENISITDSKTDSIDIHTTDVIENLLKEVGAPTSLRGYDYLVQAIRIAVYDRRNALQIYKLVYPKVAALFNTRVALVERAIRHTVEVAFERGDVDTIKDLFGNAISLDKGKTTNKEFISACAKEVERRLRMM
jgi:two-component system response regulator (stage 0 sporulation protein A)